MYCTKLYIISKELEYDKNMVIHLFSYHIFYKESAMIFCDIHYFIFYKLIILFNKYKNFKLN